MDLPLEPDAAQPTAVRAAVTRALHDLSRGETIDVDLSQLVYEDLRRLATALLRRERRSHTLQATALVHEAWLRLVDESRLPGDSAQAARRRFLGFAATAMRRILIDHARARLCHKRGGGRRVADLAEVPAAEAADAAELLDLDAAVRQLADRRPRAGHIAELRIYGGLSLAEAALAADVSLTAAKGEWALAQALLGRALRALPGDT